MNPLNRRIAYKKKSGFPIGKYIVFIVIFGAAFYLLFFQKFENRTIYERVAGFFKSEIEKIPSVTISDADKEVKNFTKREIHKENQHLKQESPRKTESEKDEIEEVIKKKLSQ